MRRLILMLTCCCLGTGLGGCDYTLREAAIVAPVDPPGGDPVQEPTDVKYYPSDEPVRYRHARWICKCDANTRVAAFIRLRHAIVNRFRPLAHPST